MTGEDKLAPTQMNETPALPPWASASRVLSILEKIAQRANSSQEPRDILQRVVSSVVQHGPWNICWSGLIDKQADRFSIYADAGFADHDPPLPFEHWNVSKTVSGQALSQGAPYVVLDALNQDTYPLLQKDAGIRKFRSVLIVPLSLGQEVGVIWFCTRVPRTFSQDEIAFAQVVGSLTSVALSNAVYERHQRKLLEHERHQSKELRRLNDLADQQYRELERLSETRTTLLRELVGDGGIVGLAAIVFGALGCGVFVIDRFGNPLAVHGDNSPLTEDERESIARIMKPRKGLVVENVRLAKRCLTTIPIDSGDTRLGYLCCSVESSALGSANRDLLIQASLHIALEMAKDRIRLETRTRLFGDFVAALSSEQEDVGNLYQTARAVGLSLHDPIRVFRGRLDHNGRIDDLPIFSRQLHRLVRPPFEDKVIVPAGERDLLILVQWPQRDLEATSFTHELRRCLDRVHHILGDTSESDHINLTVGIGPLAEGPSQLRRAEKEARQSLEVAEVMGMIGSDIDLQSLGIYSLLTSISPSRAENFTHRYLGEIRDYDRQHKTQLEATIATYIDTGGSITKTANKLHIHVSTLKYRLKRVQELSRMKISNPEHYLCFALACRIESMSQTRPDMSL